MNDQMRCAELGFREKMLESIVDKAKEELNKKALIMLAKSLDEDAELTMTGTLVMYERWLEDVRADLKEVKDRLAAELLPGE